MLRFEGLMGCSRVVVEVVVVLVVAVIVVVAGCARGDRRGAVLLYVLGCVSTHVTTTTTSAELGDRRHLNIGAPV